MQESEVGNLKELIREVAKIDHLHNKIAEQKEEIYSIKKDLGDVVNRKVSLEITNNELKANLTLTKNKLTKKEQ